MTVTLHTGYDTRPSRSCSRGAGYNPVNWTSDSRISSHTGPGHGSLRAQVTWKHYEKAQLPIQSRLLDGPGSPEADSGVWSCDQAIKIKLTGLLFIFTGKTVIHTILNI